LPPSVMIETGWFIVVRDSQCCSRHSLVHTSKCELVTRLAASWLLGVGTRRLIMLSLKNELVARLVASSLLGLRVRHTREHGACLSSLLDEILATLVELPAVVPEIVRDLADMVGPGSCLSPFGKRDLGVARRVAGDGAGFPPATWRTRGSMASA